MIQIALTTDDESEAFDYACDLQFVTGKKWDVAEVRLMKEPPYTANKYCVFRELGGDA